MVISLQWSAIAYMFVYHLLLHGFVGIHVVIHFGSRWTALLAGWIALLARNKLLISLGVGNTERVVLLNADSVE